MSILKSGKVGLRQFGLWFHTVLSVLSKSIFLLGFINSTNNTVFDAARIFYFSPLISDLWY